MDARGPSYRRLALGSAGATLALIVVGGIVRVSGSGLGCGPAGSGFDGWPLCRGDILPGLEPTALIEYSHRALGSVVGLLVLALAALAWLRHRARPGLVRGASAAAVLVVAQGLLGAATVETGLDTVLVATHLLLAMLLLALLLYLVRAAPAPVSSRPPSSGASLAQAREGTGPEPGTGPQRGLKLLASATPAAVLLAIVAGGYMAGTEGHGRADRALPGAHYACGHQFPGCNGSFLPFGQNVLIDIHLTHRVLVYLSTLLVLALLVLVLTRRPGGGVVRMAWAALAVLAAQLLVGALNVWLETEHGTLVVAHLTLATLLFGSLVDVRLRLATLPAPGPARSSPEGSGEAAAVPA